MSESETQRNLLPVPQAPAARQSSLSQGAPSAAFVSQLIAGRDRLPPQRERRLASLDRAVGAYRIGAGMAVKRMPEGYRKTILA
ncbi:hypothetical protein SAMN05216456_2742 [Devosia crocina]|uniref:Uncharacterized protein n=1 Tax=Devosia crocina TaxID=429728 RepID=A0A1I7NQZ5_9HYPH|nr:hypothetical protein [Devosia crocina]SFV37089.1 hypothetical protein SAMN05216456_2742 [Devosia crocina]